VQSQQLLAESQIFEKKILTGPEHANHPPDEVPERGDHKRKSYRIDRSGRVSKSFILQVREVLMRHKD
jgi:hypothetical protein